MCSQCTIQTDQRLAVTESAVCGGPLVYESAYSVLGKEIISLNWAGKQKNKLILQHINYSKLYLLRYLNTEVSPEILDMRVLSMGMGICISILVVERVWWCYAIVLLFKQRPGHGDNTSTWSTYSIYAPNYLSLAVTWPCSYTGLWKIHIFPKQIFVLRLTNTWWPSGRLWWKSDRAFGTSGHYCLKAERLQKQRKVWKCFSLMMLWISIQDKDKRKRWSYSPNKGFWPWKPFGSFENFSKYDNSRGRTLFSALRCVY